MKVRDLKNLVDYFVEFSPMSGITGDVYHHFNRKSKILTVDIIGSHPAGVLCKILREFLNKHFILVSTLMVVKYSSSRINGPKTTLKIKFLKSMQQAA